MPFFFKFQTSSQNLAFFNHMQPHAREFGEGTWERCAAAGCHCQTQFRLLMVWNHGAWVRRRHSARTRKPTTMATLLQSDVWQHPISCFLCQSSPAVRSQSAISEPRQQSDQPAPRPLGYMRQGRRDYDLCDQDRKVMIKHGQGSSD